MAIFRNIRRQNFVIASSKFWLELSIPTASLTASKSALSVLTFSHSSRVLARPRWLRRQSEAVRQQNCDVADRCNRADRSWHRHRVSSGPRTTACDYLLRAERGGRGSDRNSSTFGQCWALRGCCSEMRGVCCLFWMEWPAVKDMASKKWCMQA